MVVWVVVVGEVGEEEKESATEDGLNNPSHALAASSEIT